MDQFLPLIFVAVMGLSLLLYVILDGYDLGVGLLLPFASDAEKDVMIASIGPFWDANETWIVMGVGVLLIAFPSAHGIILTKLYLPATIMLFGLILRGVAFDFRVKAGDDKKVMWNRFFFLGSLVASMAQGWMLGSYITGLTGSFINTLFAVLIAVCLPALYCVLGATWLLIKTEGALFEKAVGWARTSVLPMALGLFLVSIATPLVSSVIAERWFQLPNFIGLLPIPVTSLIAMVVLVVLLKRDLTALRELNPMYLFACPVVVCLMAALGLAYSIFPDIIIGQMTIWEAASHPSALKFTLVGVLIALPCIVLYTIFIYKVFSGKASELRYD
ncbi:cytochrome bd ubiquinol oxidase subunit II [Arenicella chitinivorans]|uniref:Cytochrome bd ubiquinol oxidase subunit II n=1 Tax=Arenicella chitinivorans TaxID=1329800 RepID=A0A918VIA6_9GAMM|nr:cytochrome d ubiquinol oxidase subunit II [Arenicella chitinivorans]GGZ98471.1 cytochrome bd ubiquinol oxidase subunit II [Arenicella chitinivorans]